jgi:GT2 family glycosyltransferase
MPQITVGLVVRAGKKIKETLDSIMNQDFPHEEMEIIVVVGGSKETAPDIHAFNFSKSDIDSRIYYDEGKGLGVARQIVVNNTRAKYIIWVDGDVILSRDFIRRQLDFMRNNPDVSVAIGQYEHRELRGKAVANILSLYCRLLRIVYFGATICRVEAVKEVGGFDERIKGASEDVDLVLRMILAHWKLATNSKAKYFHKQRETWRSLVRRGVWYGFGGHFINRKYEARIKSPYRLPPVYFGLGLRLSSKVYRKHGDKKSFFIPIVGSLFSIGWCIGFVLSHIQGYGHSIKDHEIKKDRAFAAMREVKQMLAPGGR